MVLKYGTRARRQLVQFIIKTESKKTKCTKRHTLNLQTNMKWFVPLNTFKHKCEKGSRLSHVLEVFELLHNIIN